MRKFMNINHLVMLTAMAVAVSMVSCIKDEVVDAPSFHPTESELIAFGVSGWGDMEDITRGGATPNRIGNRELKSADGEFTLPMGIYVEDGIRSTSSENAETRGSVVSSADGITSFNVWAQFTKADNSTMSYFEDVKYNNTDGVFYPENAADEYYWPGSGTLDFTAVANASDAFVPVEADGAWTGYFQYSTPADATAQNDIMVAYSPDVAGDNNASVPLTFRHIMSAVNIKVGSIAKGTINSITLKGVYNNGVFNPALNTWTVSKDTTGDYAVKFNGNSFTSTGEELQNGTLINADNATFFFIPQEPGAGAIMEVSFTDSEGNSRSLSGSIEGDIWDMAKTVSYNISIGEDFTLVIEPTGKKLDAHYIISEVNVTVDKVDNWRLTVTPSNVTILPYDEANPLAQQGFWTDKWVSDGVEGDSARGSNSYSGSGSITNKKFLLFIPENIDNADRKIEILLSSTETGSTAKSTKVLYQKYPNWTGTIGWEVIDDDEQGQYGFVWNRKVAYVLKYSWNRTLGTGSNYDKDEAMEFMNGLISTYNATNYASAVEFNYKDMWSEGFADPPFNENRGYIYIDYSKLNNLSGASSETDGLANTKALFNIGGSAASMTFETVIATTLKSKGNTSDPTAFHKVVSTDAYHTSYGVPAEEGTLNDLSGILTYILKKNRYCIEEVDDGQTVTYHAVFNVNDLKWFLPASGQFGEFVANPEVAGDSKDDYWSSRAADGAQYAYDGANVQQNRTLERRVIAARVDENGYGQSAVAVTVDNSSMAGGENGEAIWSE